ncbi:hypothetical protein FJZ17_04275 [Candidatus Pacearchaeota archaeon]|nr:hypothetical protein [Candidatus Pacearchaeota archaeon]
MATKDKNSLEQCTCPEPKSAGVLKWDNRTSIHLCQDCGGKYERPSTEIDYMDFFTRLLPPTLDL